ncbi:MAG TPA: hypothetical protein VHU80_08430 [Polyangiaceae bacterium]|nr:hypothetical protein [Polyangiaceae bacterium]
MMKFLPLFLLLAGPSACMDPAHDDAVDALPGETPGVPPGPLHRPGEPCATCHGGQGPADTEFSIAGTVYLVAYQNTVASGVPVLMVDSTGVAGQIATNQAGNFWVNASDWRPTYPLQITVVFGSLHKQMQTHVGRAGSCADCHSDPAGSESPGHVWLARSQTQLDKALEPAQ